MSKVSDENYTPNTKDQPVIQLVENVLGIIDLDPCSPANPTVPALKHFTIEDDCLTQEWQGKVFLNPPYSNPYPFLEKLCIELGEGRVTEAIALLKSGTQHNKKTGVLIRHFASAICQWNAGTGSRLGFMTPDGEHRKGADFDCSLIYFGHSWTTFYAHFFEYGHVMATERTICHLLGVSPSATN